ncbi:MAG: carboxypeptidase regulatory-like domain-containing protein [Vicinamibacterales bacterium]
MRSFLSKTTALALAALLVVLSAAGLAAQSSTGSLRGTVKDAQGVIPGATVALVNEANGTSRETVTNESGEYSFPALDPAGYTVRVAVPGFRTYERKGVRVNTQAALALDIALEVGSLEETITVTADAPLIETANASTGGVIDTKTLESIPTPGRSVFLMANLEPTVQASGNAHWNRMQDQVGNSAISMGGGAVRANNFLIDGFPVTDLQNRASTNPSMEAVQEMKVQVHTYDAEMGRTGGGVMNMSARSGANQWRGSAYTVLRPKSLVSQLLIPKLRGQVNVPEEWKNGGGGGGGPIVKNKTFFWVAGEKYVDNQPQANTFLVPTAAELAGDFSAVTRNGAPITLRDPLTGLAFPGNQIPANRLNPVGLALAKAFPTADTQVDNGSPNFGMTDLLPSKAYQMSGKLDHHFNSAVSLSGFALRQVTHEANANYNPVNRYVGGSYQLDRVISTYVLNNTYIISPSTVLTLRGGYNKFDDNYNLPYEFDAAGLFNNPSLTSQMSDLNRFPTLSITGYKGAGWTNRQANGYYQYGFNGALTKLAGTHSYKFGGDYRKIGATSLNYGASTGSYTFTGTYSGNALADLLLGYPQSGNVPLNVELDGYVNYLAGFAQDDWHVNDKLTLNYGVRFEHETGMREKNNQQTVNFDTAAVSPLNSAVNLLDPITGARRQILGGLIYAGVNGAPIEQGNQPAIKVAPRVGAVYSVTDKTILRGGWGLYYTPWNYPAAGTTGWGQIGYSATTQIQQTQGTPTISMSNPFPAGLVKPSGSSQGLLTGTGGDVYFVDPNKGSGKAYQYSADLQRELPMGMSLTLGYTGLTGRDLGWGGSGNSLININQLDPKYQSLAIGETLSLVPNPFFGVAGAGQFASRATIEKGQLLRPYPQFGNVYMQQSTGAKSQYHAGIIQLRKRSTGVWGGNFSYTYSNLKDNQFDQGNYYSSSPGLQNNYTVIEGSPYYNPDQEYGLSLLNSPHKIVMAPTVNLPFGEGHKWAQSGLGDALLGGWSVTTVVTFQAGFPIGVSQNENTASFLFGGTLRPNVVEGQEFLVPGDITERIRANTTDNLYLNRAAFTATPVNRYGNAPRILPGAYSPWRNNVDLSLSKNIKTGGSTSASVRLEVLNLLNQVQWAAPASAAFGNSSFGQITNQANNMRMMQFTFRFAF